jgi:hypothetical protein
VFVSNLSQTKPAETPININKIVQTGAKTQFGGLKIGFFKVGYQVLIDVCVTILERYPTAKQIATKDAIFKYLFINS